MTITICFSLAVLILLAAAGLSIASRFGAPPGLKGGHLADCPDKPNCVCSEAVDPAHNIRPLAFEGDADEAFSRLKQTLEELGGRLEQQQGNYLHATFATPLMRYIDDVEARLDRKASLIHLRSASRVGHSDLGANRKRIETIRARFNAMR